MTFIPLLCLTLLNTVPPPQPEPSQSLRRATAVYAVAGALDVASTAAFVLRGGHEGNPLLKPMQDKPVLMLTVGVATSVTSVWAWNRFVGRKHPKLAAVGLYAAAGVHVALAARNYRAYADRQRAKGDGLGSGALVIRRAW